MPDGVPGAYRIFANMVSLAKNPELMKPRIARHASKPSRVSPLPDFAEEDSRCVQRRTISLLDGPATHSFCSCAPFCIV